MILIADSGSTKTQWAMLPNGSSEPIFCETAGINPFFITSPEIKEMLGREFSLSSESVTDIRFYGAGCVGEQKIGEVKNALKSFFNCEEIFVESDLLGAARALCGHKAGIAAILGTGSNSCFYDGNEIRHNVSPLGFILGDEGSGAVLGRKLIGDIFKNQLPKFVCDDFFDTYKLSNQEVLNSVYRQPFPNRFLAQFTRFLLKHINNEAVFLLVKESFSDFLKRNVCQYNEYNKYSINFTGSVAWYFKDVLIQACHENNCCIGVIQPNPMQGLIEFHAHA